MTCRQFFFPPHPAAKRKIRRIDLDEYEEMGCFFAQRKFNGIHAVIYVGSEVKMWDRKGGTIKNYQLTKGMTGCLRSLNLNPKEEYVFAGELLHTKAKSKVTGEQAATDTIVLFDVLYATRYLDDLTCVERQKVLYDICRVQDFVFRNPSSFDDIITPHEPKKRAFIVEEHDGSHLWLAENFAKDFLDHFDEMFHSHPLTGEDLFPEIEGLMLREKDGKLLPGDTATDVDWLVRCRKPKDKVYKW